MIIATGLGAKFDSSSAAPRSAPSPATDDPTAFFAELGDIPTIPYVPPTRGLVIAEKPVG